MVEGYLKRNHNGRFAINEQIDLTCGTMIEVKTTSGWLLMRVEHDGLDYYFLSKGLSFYPRNAYVRYS